MTPVWSARHLRQGETVYIKASPGISSSGKEGCIPSSEGLILCQGRLVSTGMDSDWDSLVKIRYIDSVSNEERCTVISESQEELYDCFFVVR